MSQPPPDVQPPSAEAATPASGESARPTPAANAKTERAARLAAALRDNLRRRKAPRAPAPPKVRN